MCSEDAKAEILSWEGGEEWFHKGNEGYEKLVDSLVSLGLVEEHALDILSTAHWISVNEYGGS